MFVRENQRPNLVQLSFLNDATKGMSLISRYTSANVANAKTRGTKRSSHKTHMEIKDPAEDTAGKASARFRFGRIRPVNLGELSRLLFAC